MNVLSLSSFPYSILSFTSLHSSTDKDYGISPESQLLFDKLRELSQHFYLPTSRANAYQKFYNLLRKWKNDVMFQSSTTKIIMHPAYQQIIGMGQIGLPFIFRELERNADHWYWALKCITGEDPSLPEDSGNLLRMREAWLNWGRIHGYIY